MARGRRLMCIYNGYTVSRCTSWNVVMKPENTHPEFTGKVQRWGNSLGLRITRGVSELSGLKAGTEVELEVMDGQLVVRPRQPTRKPWSFPTEDELIAGLTRAQAHADELPELLDSEIGD